MTQTLSQYDNESLLRAFIRSHHSSVAFTFDQQLTCITLQTEQPFLFGIPTADYIGQNISAMLEPETRSQLVPLLITAANGQSTTGTLCAANENYRVIVETLYDGPTVVGGLAILTLLAPMVNPTESNNADYWRAIWSVLPDILFRVNRQGVFVDYRAAKETNLYRPPHAFLGKAMQDVFPAELAARVHNALSTLFELGVPVSLEYMLPSDNGLRHFFEARFVLAGSDDALIIVRDITEQHQYEAAIRQSEHRFRQLTETAVDSIATHDMEGNLLYINPAGIVMLGLDPDKISTYSLLDFIPPEHQEATKARQSKRLMGSRDTFRYELEIITTSQQRKTLDVSSALISDVGDESSILIIARDISERKKAERQLLAQAEQIELFLQNTHDGLIISSRDGTILDANQAYCAMSGRTRDSLLGVNINDLTVGLTNGEIVINRKRLYGNGSLRFRSQHRHLDGHLIDLEISVYLVSDDEDREYIFMRDTTAENIALASTERGAKRLAIMHNIDAAILSAQSEHEIAEATLSHIQQLVPCYISAVMIFDFDDGVANFIASYSSGITEQNRHPVVPLDDLGLLDNLRRGEPIVVDDIATITLQNPTYDAIRQLGIKSFISVPIRADGRLLGALGLSHQNLNAFDTEDVQVAEEVAQSLAVAIQQVRLHEQVQHYAAELRELVTERTDELRSANERLLELDHLKSKFVSDVSHELRTPVNNLMMRLHLLEHDTPDQQAVHLDYLKDQIGYLGNLVEGILQISRLEVDKGAIKFQDVEINELVRQVYHHHVPAANKAQIDIKAEYAEKLPVVIGDSTGLIQAISSVVSNAVNYTEKGNVVIRTRFDDRTRHVAIDVEDTGIGIDPVDIPYIFDRFYRGSSVAKSKIMGTGLGLGIAFEIIKLHRGRIEVESEPGNGSCFTIWLPAMMDTLLD